MKIARFDALLAVTMLIVAQAGRAQAPAGLLELYDVASTRAAAAAEADEKKLSVVCAEKLPGEGVPAGYAGLWLSFLTTERGRVQIAALTKAPIVQPEEVIALRPRFNPLPTARVGPAATLDWAYVYDRNGDGRVDYLVYLQNAHAVLPEPLPPDFPKPEVLPGGRVLGSMQLLRAMVENAQMVFRHYADERFTGRVDAVVVGEFDDERPMFVRGYVAYLAPREGRAEEAWAFRASVRERTRVLVPDPGRGYLLPTEEPGRTEPAAARLEQGTRLLGLFNAALARCPAGTGTVERGAH
jgi:hypothetical protein